MKFKREYADKGVFKHKSDIEAIETGVRPVEKFDDIDFDFEGKRVIDVEGVIYKSLEKTIKENYER